MRRLEDSLLYGGLLGYFTGLLIINHFYTGLGLSDAFWIISSLAFSLAILAGSVKKIVNARGNFGQYLLYGGLAIEVSIAIFTFGWSGWLRYGTISIDVVEGFLGVIGPLAVTLGAILMLVYEEGG